MTIVDKRDKERALALEAIDVAMYARNVTLSEYAAVRHQEGKFRASC